MTCSQCQGIEDLFSAEYVAKELKRYRKRGPDKTTQILIEGLKQEGVEGLSLLDIGGGLGAIQHALLQAGVENAVDIEASSAYLNAVKAETARRGFAERVDYRHGNFVEVASQVPPADVVTLNRVICCYPDVEKMVGLSASRAERLYGLVYPRTDWWMKVGHLLESLFLRLVRSRYRPYLHATEVVEALVKEHGLKRYFYKKTLIWQIAVYRR